MHLRGFFGAIMPHVKSDNIIGLPVSFDSVVVVVVVVVANNTITLLIQKVDCSQPGTRMQM